VSENMAQVCSAKNQCAGPQHRAKMVVIVTGGDTQGAAEE